MPVLTWVLAFTPTSTEAAPGLDLFEQNLQLAETDADKALEFFREIPQSSDRFRIATEESMKILYRTEHWPEFFAYAQYYRRRWPTTAKGEGMDVLELLGLLRHCQTLPLHALLSEYRARWPKSKLPILDQITSLSELHFKGKAGDKTKELKPFQDHLEARVLWKGKEEWYTKAHPKQLRVKVANECSN